MEAGDGVAKLRLAGVPLMYTVNVFAQTCLVHPYAGVIGPIFTKLRYCVRETCHEGSVASC